MLESLGPLASSPWIYAVVALSVLLDVFVPVLPSGVIVVTAATATAAGSTTVAQAADKVSHLTRLAHELPSLLLLGLCATTASVLGDLVAFRLARSGSTRLSAALSRSRRLTRAHESLGRALAAGGGLLVVIARFAPAGRSVMSFGAGTSQRRTKEFLPWSALAGAAWAVYSVGLGYFGGQWLGASWFGTFLSVLALFGAGAVAAYVVRRRPAARAAGADVRVIGCDPAPPPATPAHQAGTTAPTPDEQPRPIRAA
ncbi:DedA family protein [Streptomyces montanisoli]|uniref:VTT domain-containing protein n=1 Tax=Streptomyces montanisoli TaxID=2798581 RepID=A0A940MHT2_9ACTN|nr:VTT domain-containing protein [Streptomyces montanisoli]MBP0460310.1 VTT domain-containing protein [Streptomyces montanisoli]